MKIVDLHNAIAKVCSILGVSTSGRIDFAPEATPEQKIAAQEIYENWVDPPDPDWRGLGEALPLDPHYLRITTSSAIATKLSSNLEQLVEFEATGNDNRIPQIQSIWNTIAVEANPTEAEIAAINAILIAHKIDQFFLLNAPSGKMIVP